MKVNFIESYRIQLFFFDNNYYTDWLVIIRWQNFLRVQENDYYAYTTPYESTSERPLQTAQ